VVTAKLIAFRRPVNSITKMPVTRSSSFSPKDMDAAQTLMRFHYDWKASAAVSEAPTHMMSLRGRAGRTKNVSSRPRRECAVYTPGMYTEDEVV